MTAYAPVAFELEAEPRFLVTRFGLSFQTIGIVKAVCGDCCSYANQRLHIVNALDGVEEALTSWIAAQPELREFGIYRGGSHVALLAPKYGVHNSHERIAIFKELVEEVDHLGIGDDGQLDQERDL